MELRLHHIIDHLYNIFLENDGSKNCAQLLEEEVNKMFGTQYLNIHDANDMQSHKLGDAMFDEDDIFSPPSFDVQFFYNDSMPPIYDDYNDESGFGEVLVMNPPFWMRLQLTMITKLLSMMIMVMMCML